VIPARVSHLREARHARLIHSAVLVRTSRRQRPGVPRVEILDQEADVDGARTFGARPERDSFSTVRCSETTSASRARCSRCLTSTSRTSAPFRHVQDTLDVVDRQIDCAVPLDHPRKADSCRGTRVLE
jgi:hypothetical protein